MSLLTRWPVLVLLLLGVSLAGTVGGCALIERDVADRSRAALAAAGVEGVTLDASYRSVSMSGPAALRDRALAAVGGLEAVRSADYGVTAAPVPEAAPVVAARYDGDRLVLTGTVAQAEQRTAIAAVAKSDLAGTALDDRIEVDASATAALPDRLQAFAAAAAALPAATTEGTATLRDGRLRVTGRLRAQGLGALAEPLRLAEQAGLTVTRELGSGPAAAAQPQAVQRRLGDLLSGTTIQFDTASADIREVSEPILDRAAQIMVPAFRGNRDLRVRVEGHTDDVGNPARNRNLSVRRAQAVLAALVDRGVPRARLTAVGFGQARPVADNDTEAGRRQNRRIAFTVLGG